MIVVYIAGPFRAATPWLIEQNIRRAEAVGLEVAKLGCCPVIPHSQYRFFQNSMPDEFWLQATLEQVSRCDALMLVEDWNNSVGTRGEVKRAYELKIPAFHDILGLHNWITNDLGRLAHYFIGEGK
jgi:hypothetical protein